MDNLTIRDGKISDVNIIVRFQKDMAMETENKEIECQVLFEQVNNSGNPAIEMQDRASSTGNNSPKKGNEGQTPVDGVSITSSTSLQMEPVGEQDNTTSPGNN